MISIQETIEKNLKYQTKWITVTLYNNLMIFIQEAIENI